MGRLSAHHQHVDDSGAGRCSVPMFSGYGGDAGFCDRPAYGERPEGKTHRRWDGFEWRDDGRYAGHVPGLACVAHGGPASRVYRDGAAWCAVMPDFVNPQESVAGFGDTPESARAALVAAGGAS